MPKKRITANVTIAVPDEEHGPAVQFYAPPGTEVILEADEADRIIARWGGEVLEMIPDESGASPNARLA